MTRSGGETERRERATAIAGGHADARALTAVDKITLGYQRAYPRTRLAVGNLLVGHGPAPEIQELRDLVADRARAFPPLTHRVTPAGWGRLVWTPDTDFDPASHVHGYRLPAGSGFAGLREAIERLSAIEISLKTPPWQLWLLHGDRPDGFALLFRGSHAQMDGAALDVVLGKLFGQSSPEEPRAPRRPLPEQRRYSPLTVGKALARSVGWLASTTAIAPFTGAPTGETRHAWLEIDLARLRTIGRAYVATVNDIFLAALAGALRAWCPPEAGTTGTTRWVRRRAVHAAMPVSTRLAAQREVVSNYLTTVRIALPYGEASMRGRVDAIRRQTIQLKRNGTPGVAERLFLWTVPAPLRTAVLSTGIATRGFALTASNPAGLTGPFEVLGRPIIDAVPVPPVPAGQRLAVLLSGLDEQVRVGFSTDASVPGHERLAELFAAELDALEAEAGIHQDPSDGAVARPVGSLVGPTSPSAPDSPATHFPAQDSPGTHSLGTPVPQFPIPHSLGIPATGSDPRSADAPVAGTGAGAGATSQTRQ
ncbi:MULTISPECIES: wax ester/triacylglycerol synthase domain-containing protein [Pseudofrankia]|uniref:wax ester/triacylglycerol synthase domain-containing protein n=1 Tax=Pseudofrankia TaxID=2994363 RepID=UPI000234B400|nr:MULTISPECIES: wax ester/triacylglycerol synthase domain-containing protein [Pseudofrankia]OHV40588.1 hypothetical protein BCD49_08475 [Pseudofrankia sp. EUN1h]